MNDGIAQGVVGRVHDDLESSHGDSCYSQLGRKGSDDVGLRILASIPTVNW